MNPKIKETKQSVYTTEDGKQFADTKEAEKHQKSLDGRKFFVIRHGADLTEGRGTTRTVYASVESNYCQELYLLDACYKLFGSQVGYVQGCSPTYEWRISEAKSPPKEEDIVLRIKGSQATWIGEYYVNRIYWERTEGKTHTMNLAPK